MTSLLLGSSFHPAARSADVMTGTPAAVLDHEFIHRDKGTMCWIEPGSLRALWSKAALLLLESLYRHTFMGKRETSFLFSHCMFWVTCS